MRAIPDPGERTHVIWGEDDTLVEVTVLGEPRRYHVNTDVCHPHTWHVVRCRLGEHAVDVAAARFPVSLEVVYRPCTSEDVQEALGLLHDGMRLADAARQLGVNYQTLRHRILRVRKTA